MALKRYAFYFQALNTLVSYGSACFKTSAATQSIYYVFQEIFSDG